MEPDLGLYGPDSVSWRVHASPIMLVGGLRSLYLQSLHPRAVAGISQNSTYRSDPHGRLMRTSDYVGTLLYGTTTEAEAAARRVRGLHARLRGTDPVTGEVFRLDDPELLRWVHVAEVESFLSTAQRAGVPLTAADVDAYYTEQRRAAALIGLDPATVPGTAAEVADYYREIRPQLRMTREAAETFLFLTAPAVPGRMNFALKLALNFGPPRAVYFGVASLAIGLLPAWARKMYGLPGLATTDLSTEVSARALRLALSALPQRYRISPQRRQALERADRLATVA